MVAPKRLLLWNHTQSANAPPATAEPTMATTCTEDEKKPSAASAMLAPAIIKVGVAGNGKPSEEANTLKNTMNTA
jgi:hypothetical protein